MANIFNARLDITTILNSNINIWKISAVIVDNTGTFFAGDVNIGNIIYHDTSSYGVLLSRYKVINIYPETNGATLIADIQWDVLNDENYIEPIPYCSAIIGQVTNRLGFTAMPSVIMNGVDENLITLAKNYEQQTITDNLIALNYPNLQNDPDTNSNDTSIADTRWVNDTIKENTIKQYITKEKIDLYKVVYSDSNNYVGLADANDINIINKVIGISLDSKLENELINIQVDGKITNPLWNFKNIGQPVFIGTSGNIKQDILEITGFIQQIGIAIASDTININLDETILL